LGVAGFGTAFSALGFGVDFAAFPGAAAVVFPWAFFPAGFAVSLTALVAAFSASAALARTAALAPSSP